MPDRIPALIVSGTVGAGKTTIAEEISVLFEELSIRHLWLDLDALAQVYPRSPDDPYNQRLMFANLAAVWVNVKPRAPEYVVMACVVESPEELPLYKAAIPEADFTVVRVIASSTTIEPRLHGREVGLYFDTMWARSQELAGILDATAIEAFTVNNDGRPVREVAIEVLTKLGWAYPTTR